MARNLRRKASVADRMLVYDINMNSAKRFVEEMESTTPNLQSPHEPVRVDISKTPRCLAEKSVSHLNIYAAPLLLFMMSCSIDDQVGAAY